MKLQNMSSLCWWFEILLDRFTPLHHAALGGNGEIVMALLGVDNDVNVKDKKGTVPLWDYYRELNVQWLRLSDAGVVHEGQ